MSHPVAVSPDDGPRNSRPAAPRVGDGARDAELPGQGRGEFAAGGQAVRIQVRLRTGRGAQEDHAGTEMQENTWARLRESRTCQVVFIPNCFPKLN